MYYDQHVHTHYSFDSSAQFTDYLEQTTHPFVTTEHLELSNPEDAGQDDMPDFPAYVAEEKHLSSFYSNQLLRGVEVGYFAPRASDLAAYVAAGDYDIVLLSFHHDGKHDYQDTSFRELNPQQHVRNYYQTMLTGLQAFSAGDVLAHFDYGLRVLDVTPDQLTAWAGDLVRQILQLVIDRHMALELNTKSMYRWHNAALYDLVLGWYLEMGGKLITLGSDAHTGEKFESDFAAAKQMLRAHGVTRLATYQQHVATMTTF